MMISDNDYHGVNARGEVVGATEIITHLKKKKKTALRNISSAHQLDIVEVSSGYFFVLEKKYGALITGQQWSLRP